MKKFNIVLLVLIFIYSNQIKGDDNSDKKILHHGIQFQISNILDLSSYNDYTFSYRYNFNNNNGLRFGILLNVGKSDENGKNIQESISSNFKNNSNSYKYKISIQYLNKIITYENFSMIIGGGPYILHSSGDNDNLSSEEDYLLNSTSQNSISGYGFDIILGVEYSLAKNVIISGEYGLTLLQRKIKDAYNTKKIFSNGDELEIYNYSDENKQFNISNMDVVLGISIFF